MPILLEEAVETGIPAVRRIGGREEAGPSFLLPANHAEHLARELAKESGKRQGVAEQVVAAAEAEAAEGFAAEAEASTSSIVEPAADGSWWEVVDSSTVEGAGRAKDLGGALQAFAPLLQQWRWLGHLVMASWTFN